MDALKALESVIASRKVEAYEGSYTNYLFEKGTEKICKKVGEEATEVVIASIQEDREQVVEEIADLSYHILVLMAELNISLEDVDKVLEKRAEVQGNKKPERRPIEKI